MAKTSGNHRNLWGLTVLCLLRERPMHPYEMQRLIRERNKDAFLDLKRGSLYHNIERLQRVGLIEAIETRREGRRPERTTYQLTPQGSGELRDWLIDLLANPGKDAVPFFAALSFLGHLKPDEVLEPLRTRVARLEAELSALDANLQTLAPRIGRLMVVEEEYIRALRVAELAWVRSLLADLEQGTLTWDHRTFLFGPEPPPR